MTQLLEYRPGMAFDYHPAVDLFRPMTETEFDELLGDVAINGVCTAVWRYQGQIVDGRNRCRAWLRANELEAEKPEALSLECPECRKPVKALRANAGGAVQCPHCAPVCDRPECTKKAAAGKIQQCSHRPTMVPILQTLCRRVIPPLPVIEWDGHGSLIGHVFSLNLHRRHLAVAERAWLALKAADLMEEEARQRQLDTLRKGGSPSVSRGTNGGNKGKTTEKLGKIAGVSARTMARAKKVKDKGSQELAAAVETGKIKNLSAAARIADLSPEEQLAAIRKETEKTHRSNRVKDLAESLAAWRKTAEKLLKQMRASDPAVPELVAAVEGLVGLMAKRSGRPKRTR